MFYERWYQILKNNGIKVDWQVESTSTPQLKLGNMVLSIGSCIVYKRSRVFNDGPNAAFELRDILLGELLREADFVPLTGL